MTTHSEVLQNALAYTPLVHGEVTPGATVVCGGMGGSALPALMAQFFGVTPCVLVHRDYGLPSHVLPEAHYVAISYSGNTEETLSFAHAALERGYPLSVVSGGGALLALAKEKNLPYVELPTGDSEPRDAIVPLTKALLALLGETPLLETLSDSPLEAGAAQDGGERLATELAGCTPLFYSSERNRVLAYIGKIQANETAKIPAFSNTFPEINHNEMQGFGAPHHTLLVPFVVVFLQDATDHERVQRRMLLTRELLEKQGVKTITLELPSGSRAETFLYAWWSMRCMARTLAQAYQVQPDATPLIAEFKKTL